MSDLADLVVAALVGEDVCERPDPEAPTEPRAGAPREANRRAGSG
jgi:hypothetical protein